MNLFYGVFCDYFLETQDLTCRTSALTEFPAWLEII